MNHVSEPPATESRPRVDPSHPPSAGEFDPLDLPFVHFLAIVVLAVVAAIAYGIAHDQVTARICIEYFTMGHPHVIDSEDPTVLALVWGVIATWWMGLILGVPLALAARLGSWPKRHVRTLAQPIAEVLLVMAVGSLLAGVIGYIGAVRGWAQVPDWIWARIPESRQTPYVIDMWAHNAAYLVGALGGVFLWARVLVERRQAARSTTPGTEAYEVSAR